MGSYDGAEVCELVGLFILNDLCNEYGKDNIGLYRDDGLAIFKHTSGPQAERIRKDITRRFKTHGLNITIQTNMKIVNYLDVTFDLTNSTCCPYRKPNDHPQYINTKSNHPPNIIKQIPASISRRISDNSSNEDAFNKAKPVYNSAWKPAAIRKHWPTTKTSNLHDLDATDKEILSGTTLLSVKTSRLTSAELSSNIFLSTSQNSTNTTAFSTRITSKLATAVWTTWNRSLTNTTRK